MSISNYLENKILDALRNVSLAVANVYVSLHTADPGETGASEAVGGSYARQAVTLTAASGGATENSGAINFTLMPAATITHIGLWDALELRKLSLGRGGDGPEDTRRGGHVSDRRRRPGRDDRLMGVLLENRNAIAALQARVAELEARIAELESPWWTRLVNRVNQWRKRA